MVTAKAKVKSKTSTKSKAKTVRKSKLKDGEIAEIIESKLYSRILTQIDRFGIALVSLNYVLFEEKTVDGEKIHITLGYYGNKALSGALTAMSAEMLKNRLDRKCKSEIIELEELNRIVLAHTRKFDKLFSGMEIEL